MKLIDADKLKKCFSSTLYGRKVYSAEEILMTIQTRPTIDAEPVKHGHWIKKDHVFYDNYRYECSECHHYDEHSESREVSYCWHCGALMDEVNNDSN